MLGRRVLRVHWTRVPADSVSDVLFASEQTFPLKSQVLPGREIVGLDCLGPARWLLCVPVPEAVCPGGQVLVCLALCTASHSVWHKMKPRSGWPPDQTYLLGVCRPQTASPAGGKPVNGEWGVRGSPTPLPLSLEMQAVGVRPQTGSCQAGALLPCPP